MLFVYSYSYLKMTMKMNIRHWWNLFDWIFMANDKLYHRLYKYIYCDKEMDCLDKLIDDRIAFSCRSIASPTLTLFVERKININSTSKGKRSSQKINIWCHLLKSVDSLSNSSRDYRKVYSGIVVRRKKIFS